MATHRVRISVTKGNITYSNDRVRARRGDEIEWSCKNGDFAVHPGLGGPCYKGRYRGQQGTSKKGKIRKSARKATYKYFVAVAIGNKVWTDDPWIIVI